MNDFFYNPRGERRGDFLLASRNFYLAWFLASLVCELLRESKPEAHEVVPVSRAVGVADDYGLA